MINIKDEMDRFFAIKRYFVLAIAGLDSPKILSGQIKQEQKFIKQVFPKCNSFLKMKKYELSNFIRDSVQEQRTLYLDNKVFAKNLLKKQTVVSVHSYMEVVMAKIIRIILRKHQNILIDIYNKKDKLPFKVKEIIDNKERIIEMMIEEEINRFIRNSLKEKNKFFKRYFKLVLDQDLDLNRKPVYLTMSLEKIDSIRHNIIHSEKEIEVSDKDIMDIFLYASMWTAKLLSIVRNKFKVDIKWI